MKNAKLISSIALVTSMILSMSSFASYASAQAVTTGDANTSIGVSAGTGFGAGLDASGTRGGLGSKRLRNGSSTPPNISQIIARADTAITNRVNSLNNLLTKVNGMTRLSASEKSTLTTEIQANITDMTTLKAKIDTDTDATTLRTDIQSITAAYRIYALILPQVNILAAVDKVDTLASMFGTVSTKLQTRISAAASAGQDVTSLNTTLADLNSKVSDAQTRATNAQNLVVSLAPDNGDKTVAQSNTTALKQARADIKTATGDLTTAREDAQTIIKGLTSMPASAGASANTTVSTSSPQ